MSKKQKINFLPIVGDLNIISFSIKCREDEIFETVIQKAIHRLRELDPSLEGENYRISTASADVTVKKMYFSKTLDEVISVYGGSFCIKSPFIF